MKSTRSAETWFVKLVAVGIQRLIPLSLEGQPGVELLGVAIDTWTSDLWETRWWREARDVPRIEAAFAAVRLDCTRWPTMADFLTRLPRAEQAVAPASAPKLEWARGEPVNQSIIAIANCRFNCERLETVCPKWAAPGFKDDATEAAVLRAIDALRVKVGKRARVA